MKKFFVAALLISNVYLFAQYNPMYLLPKQTPGTVTQNFNFNKPVFTFTQLQFYTKYDFSVYNRTTMFNENYTVYNGKIEYKNAIIIPENLIVNIKMDSFNPNASDSFEGALFTGALNLLADLINVK